VLTTLTDVKVRSRASISDFPLRKKKTVVENDLVELSSRTIRIPYVSLFDSVSVRRLSAKGYVDVSDPVYQKSRISRWPRSIHKMTEESISLTAGPLPYQLLEAPLDMYVCMYVCMYSIRVLEGRTLGLMVHSSPI
jgi:hypothetical protein